MENQGTPWMACQKSCITTEGVRQALVAGGNCCTSERKSHVGHHAMRPWASSAPPGHPHGGQIAHTLPTTSTQTHPRNA